MFFYEVTYPDDNSLKSNDRFCLCFVMSVSILIREVYINDKV